MPIYLGTFLIAFATLTLQVALTRLFSVITWYHMAFLAVGTAMVGMTAGATAVYLDPERYQAMHLRRNLSRACLCFAVSVPVMLVFLCSMPLAIWPSTIMGELALVVITATCAWPFYYAGIAVTLVLTKCPLPVGRVYASDLIGASLGCLFVLAGLEWFDTPSVILLTAGIGAAAATVYGLGQVSRVKTLLSVLLMCGLVASGLVNSRSAKLIRPLMVKGNRLLPQAYESEHWNSLSRIVVHPLEDAEPQLWGPSPSAPREPTKQCRMNIDGVAGTTLRRFQNDDDIEHLRYDVTNLAYFLRPKGGACVIGVGGGRDVQSALLFGQPQVTAVELNPVFIRLLQGEFKDFAGIGGRPEVELIVDEARSYLSRSDRKFSVLQMSLIDTWASTGAGACSLSENSLYTVESWRIFSDRLADDGIFTVSRWFDPENLGETGRLMSLAVASLIQQGVADASAQIIVVTSDKVATLLLSRKPFTSQDLAKIDEVCAQFGYAPQVIPGRPVEHPVLRKILSVKTLDELERAVENEPLRLSAPTDESPYFFNVVRLGQAARQLVNERGAHKLHSGMVQGNLHATRTLILLILSLSLLTFATILVPLLAGHSRPSGDQSAAPILWSGAFYFSLIGAGFMLVEIGLIQKLSVLLSHPTYALGILLFTIILSAGLGSLASERLPLKRAPWILLYPVVTAAAIVACSFLVSHWTATMSTAPLSLRIAVSIATIFPMGMLLGLFFPTGMSLVRSIRPGETPWYWALNGIFGVLCSSIAVVISIFASISLNFYIAAVCYLLVGVCTWKLNRHQQSLPV